MFKTIPSLLVAAVFAVLAPAAAPAQNLISLEDVAKVTLLQGWRTSRGTHMAAIQISLADGWKTYWRSAGESGIPPRFSWSGSENLQQVQVHWPIPTVFDPTASRSYGYKGTVVIPIELTPANDSNGIISVRGKLDIGVCEDICVPMNVTLAAQLPNAGKPDAQITASLSHRPTGAVKAGVKSATCRVEPISDGLRITADISLPEQGGHEVVVFELPDQSIWIDEARSTRNGRHLTAVTDLVPASGAPFLLNRSDIRMTVFGTKGTVDIRGCTAG